MEKTSKRLQQINKKNLEKTKWLLENTNHNYIYSCLFGSQNYGMDLFTSTYQSDFDIKAIIVPSLEDLILEKKVSKTYTLDDNSQIDVKDIRLFGQILKKQNPAYLEVLFSEYTGFNQEFEGILKMREDIVAADKKKLLYSIQGTIFEKRKSLYKSLENEKYKEWGYNPKDLCHIIRLYYLAYDYFAKGKTFKNSLIPPEEIRKLCIKYKTEKTDLSEVIKVAEDYVSKIQSLVKEILENNDFKIDKETYKKLDDEIYRIVESNLSPFWFLI